jgi:hypothetical protein
MNRAFSLATLALALTGGSVSRAAEKPQPVPPPASAILQNAPKGTVVFDDDGGRAQIIPRRAVPAQEATYHGGPVVPRGAVQAVFLGGGWRKPENQGKEAEVTRALRSQDGPDAAPLARYGVKAWESLNAPLEDTAGDPLSGTLISDLEIQARLDGMVSGGEPLDANAVFVVFLAPGLGSKLGSRTSEDFAAYHNHYHSSAGLVRYVVVPYDADLSRWASAARRSLRQALINPEGNGWY